MFIPLSSPPYDSNVHVFIPLSPPPYSPAQRIWYFGVFTNGNRKRERRKISQTRTKRRKSCCTKEAKRREICPGEEERNTRLLHISSTVVVVSLSRSPGEGKADNIKPKRTEAPQAMDSQLGHKNNLKLEAAAAVCCTKLR